MASTIESSRNTAADARAGQRFFAFLDVVTKSSGPRIGVQLIKRSPAPFGLPKSAHGNEILTLSAPPFQIVEGFKNAGISNHAERWNEKIPHHASRSRCDVCGAENGLLLRYVEVEDPECHARRGGCRVDGAIARQRCRSRWSR